MAISLKIEFFDKEWDKLIGPRFAWAHKKEISIIKQKIFQVFILNGGNSSEAIIESGLITLFYGDNKIMGDVAQDMMIGFMTDPIKFIKNDNGILMAKTLFGTKVSEFIKKEFKRTKYVKPKHYFRAIVVMLVNNELEHSLRQQDEEEFGIYS